jgi:hypothetical protein
VSVVAIEPTTFVRAAAARGEGLPGTSEAHLLKPPTGSPPQAGEIPAGDATATSGWSPFEDI